MHPYIKRILIASIVVSLLPTLLRAFNIHIPILEWLALSSFGLLDYKLFQPFTAPLLFSFDIRIDPFALLGPLFMVFVARLVNFIFENEGMKRVLKFYLLNCVFVALSLVSYSFLTGQHFVQLGPEPLFYALVSYILFVVPHLEILFFVIPLKARSFIFVGLGLSLLFSVEGKRLAPFIATFSGTLFGYLYGLYQFKAHSPHTFLHGLEKWIFSLFDLFKPKPKCVIVDFKTGRRIQK